MNLAKVIYDAFPCSGDLQIEPEDLRDFKTLYDLMLETTPAELGDGLFRFIVIEAMESGEDLDGKINVDRVIRALERASKDLDKVINAIREKMDE